MRVTIVGAQPYRVRSPANEQAWETVVKEMHYDRHCPVGIVADVDQLQARGVRRDFVTYMIRNGFLRVVD